MTALSKERGFVISPVKIKDLTAWILAPLIIWLITVLAGVVLPLFIFKKTLSKVKQKGQGEEIIN